MVKDNQPGLLAELTLLFDPECVSAGWSAPPVDFSVVQSIEKGHGRLEKRVLTASSMLAGYSDWPYLAQAVKVERTRISKLKQEQKLAYGITSLPATDAGAARLLRIGRAQWGSRMDCITGVATRLRYWRRSTTWSVAWSCARACAIWPNSNGSARAGWISGWTASAANRFPTPWCAGQAAAWAIPHLP